MDDSQKLRYIYTDYTILCSNNQSLFFRQSSITLSPLSFQQTDGMMA